MVGRFKTIENGSELEKLEKVEKSRRPGLKFNPVLALISLRTTGPWGKKAGQNFW